MDTDATGQTRCLNCGTALTGPYCANCGQKHQPEIHTVGHFIGEAFENITHADSRLWRTLWVLIAKPGHLTREFFSGRRMRYLPPVRFYLIVSLAFFVLAGAINEHGGSLVKIDAKDDVNSCNDIKYDGPFKAAAKPLLMEQCRKFLADNGRGLARAFFANVPKALFVLLPLLAAFMMLLYWRPRRHYVEHLLLLLHNHIFLLLGYSLLLLLGLALPDNGAVGLIGFLFHVFLAWYFYRGMKVVYGQGRALTSLKLVLLATVYVAGATLAFALTFVFSAVTF